MRRKSSAQAAISTTRMIMLLLFMHKQSTADLVTTPKDAEALIGTLTFFNCSSSSSPSKIQWFHYDPGIQQDRKIVYGYDKLYGSFANRSRIEPNDTAKELNLVIERVSFEDAGTFECQDDMGRGASGFAQLSVLESNPVCDWKIENRQETGSSGDSTKKLLHLNCTVNFRGNKPPAMIWKRSGSNEPIITGVTQINVSATIVTYALQTSDDFDGQSFQCESTKSVTTQYTCRSDPTSSSSTNVTTNVLIVVVSIVSILVIAAIIVVAVILIKKRAGKIKEQGALEKEQSSAMSIVDEAPAVSSSPTAGNLEKHKYVFNNENKTDEATKKNKHKTPVNQGSTIMDAELKALQSNKEGIVRQRTIEFNMRNEQANNRPTYSDHNKAPHHIQKKNKEEKNPTVDQEPAESVSPSHEYVEEHEELLHTKKKTDEEEVEEEKKKVKTPSYNDDNRADIQEDPVSKETDELLQADTIETSDHQDGQTQNSEPAGSVFAPDGNLEERKELAEKVKETAKEKDEKQTKKAPGDHDVTINKAPEAVLSKKTSKVGNLVNQFNKVQGKN